MLSDYRRSSVRDWEGNTVNFVYAATQMKGERRFIGNIGFIVHLLLSPISKLLQE